MSKIAQFRIAHLYPRLMNLYGDRGNLICIQKRLQWYGHDCIIEPINLHESLDYSAYDMLFMGGGSAQEQRLASKDWLRQADDLWAELEKGLPALCICGAFQFLGSYYEAVDGQKLKGLGLFDLYTIYEPDRLIGNIVIASQLTEETTTVVGFENHSGRTYLHDDTLQPFGTVLEGFGNNGQDGQEGLRYKNLIGTYLHGPLLPKNPVVADFFIHAMAERQGITISGTLNDRLEDFAHRQTKQRILND